LIDELLRGGDALLELTNAAVDDQPSTSNVDQLVTNLTNLHAEREKKGGQASPPTTGEGRPSQTSLAEGEGATATHPKDLPPQGGAESGGGGAERHPKKVTSEHLADSFPSPTEERAWKSNARQATIRVRVDRLDRLINLTGELVVGQQVLSAHVQMMRQLMTIIQQQEEVLVGLDVELRQVRLPLEQRQTVDHALSSLLNTSDQSRQLLRHNTELFSQYVDQEGLIVGDLEQEVMAARMLPVSTVFASLPRAVRELANSLKKEVVLELAGETTEIDRKLLEAISDPLMHLVRNAVDHGIEPPAERTAQNKPSQGIIKVAAEATGGEVRIVISDDGRGMYPQKMREIVVRKGLMSKETAESLSDHEALEVIFLPGFTTAQIITDVSGRGVGMDVVRTNITELGGHVLVDSLPAQGTRFTLVLPLTLVTTRILLVRVGKHLFALPASGCRGIIWAYREQIRTIEGRATIPHEGRTVPLIRLADLLNIEAPPAFHATERVPTVLIGNPQRTQSLIVDQLVDEREAVVKPLGPLLEGRPTERRYSGAIQTADGQLVLLLNPIALMEAMRGITLIPPSALNRAKKRPHLLVTEDSFTTRELLRSILLSAGYEVTAAIHGGDALEKLRTQTFDLIVTDVEMPQVDGFQLTARLRQELGLTDLPVIIMTSLASDEHKRRGLEVGAQAYIVKSQFNQDNLLEVIGQLLGHETVP
jgi:two-component system chemotaxis sensor kinase CheA